MIEALRKESYFGENTPLVCDHSGDFTRPVNFRKRYYKILKAAGIKRKGLHSLHHHYVKSPTKKFTNILIFQNGTHDDHSTLFKYVLCHILGFNSVFGENINSFNQRF